MCLRSTSLIECVEPAARASRGARQCRRDVMFFFLILLGCSQILLFFVSSFQQFIYLVSSNYPVIALRYARFFNVCTGKDPYAHDRSDDNFDPCVLHEIIHDPKIETMRVYGSNVDAVNVFCRLLFSSSSLSRYIPSLPLLTFINFFCFFLLSHSTALWSWCSRVHSAVWQCLPCGVT